MTRYLLDTSAVIDPPGSKLESDAEYVISSITVAEFNAGIYTTNDIIERAVRVDRLLWLSDTFDVIPFTESAARMYGQLNAATLAAGRNPRGRRMDLLIASTAAVQQLPLVTYNAKDFAGLSPLVEVVDLGQ